MCQQPACHEKAFILREIMSTSCLSALPVFIVPMPLQALQMKIMRSTSGPSSCTCRTQLQA